MTAPGVDFKIHWLKMVPVPEGEPSLGDTME